MVTPVLQKENVYLMFHLNTVINADTIEPTLGLIIKNMHNYFFTLSCSIIAGHGNILSAPGSTLTVRVL